MIRKSFPFHQSIILQYFYKIRIYYNSTVICALFYLLCIKRIECIYNKFRGKTLLIIQSLCY